MKFKKSMQNKRFNNIIIGSAVAGKNINLLDELIKVSTNENLERLQNIKSKGDIEINKEDSKFINDLMKIYNIDIWAK